MIRVQYCYSVSPSTFALPMPLISTTLEEILEIFVLDEYEQVGNPVLSTDHAISTQNTETCPR